MMGIGLPEWLDYRVVRPTRFTRNAIPALPPQGKLRLSETEADGFLKAAITCPGNPYRSTEAEGFIRAAQRAAGTVLTPGTRQAVPKTLDFGFGALLLENLPVDPVPPPTPGVCGALEPDYKPTFVSEFVTVALGALVGAEIFNFRQEGRGSAPLLDNVVPVPELRAARGAGGFEDNFPFHCESAWHRMRPDYVALVGIRKDPGARTLVTSVTSILEQELIAGIPEDCFRLKPPQLYIEMAEQGIPLGTSPYRACAPIDARAGVVNVNLNGTDCLGDEAVQWLTTFEEVIEANAFSAVLGPGNALVMNNHRTCHTRTGFSPRLGPDARWFLRGNFKKNLWGAVPGSRPDGLSDADLKLLAAAGWSDERGSLTASFLPFAEKPRQFGRLPPGMRSLAAKALLLTPVQGSRIV